MMTYKIATWNVNSIKARIGHVQDFLRAHTPDIVFLQELKGETLPPIADDYHAVFVGQKAYNGVAILSRTPVTIMATQLAGDTTDEQARYLEVDWNGLRLINLYLPNGNPMGTEKFDYKIKWMERLVDRVNELRNTHIPFLLGGDFNVIPDDKDCFDPNLWRNDALYHPETVKQFRRLLNTGLTDAFRVFNQNPHEYTFWDYQAGAWPRNKGIRIDHFLTSPAVTDRLVSCEIDKSWRGTESPSDHVPLMIKLSAIT